jgi:hypothetical protein
MLVALNIAMPLLMTVTAIIGVPSELKGDSGSLMNILSVFFFDATGAL